MANVTVPYSDPGVASFTQLDTYRTSFLLMGDSPPLKSFPMLLETGVTLSQFQVVMRNPSGKLVPATRSTAVNASKVLTFSGVGTANDTITIGGVVYTLKATVTTTANEVLIGASAAATAANLTAAINGAAGGGTTYGSLTAPHPSVYATVSGADVTVSAREPGLAGNSIAIAESGTGTAWAGGATALSGGTGGAAAIGIVTQAVASGASTTMTVPVWYSGWFNIDALVWDASFATDAQKLVAFDGAPSPTQILLSKR